MLGEIVLFGFFAILVLLAVVLLSVFVYSRVAGWLFWLILYVVVLTGLWAAMICVVRVTGACTRRTIQRRGWPESTQRLFLERIRLTNLETSLVTDSSWQSFLIMVNTLIRVLRMPIDFVCDLLMRPRLVVIVVCFVLASAVIGSCQNIFIVATRTLYVDVVVTAAYDFGFPILDIAQYLYACSGPAWVWYCRMVSNFLSTLFWDAPRCAPLGMRNLIVGIGQTFQAVFTIVRAYAHSADGTGYPWLANGHVDLSPYFDATSTILGGLDPVTECMCARMLPVTHGVLQTWSDPHLANATSASVNVGISVWNTLAQGAIDVVREGWNGLYPPPATDAFFVYAITACNEMAMQVDDVFAFAITDFFDVQATIGETGPYGSQARNFRAPVASESVARHALRGTRPRHHAPSLHRAWDTEYRYVARKKPFAVVRARDAHGRPLARSLATDSDTYIVHVPPITPIIVNTVITPLLAMAQQYMYALGHAKYIGEANFDLLYLNGTGVIDELDVALVAVREWVAMLDPNTAAAVYDTAYLLALEPALQTWRALWRGAYSFRSSAQTTIYFREQLAEVYLEAVLDRASNLGVDLGQAGNRLIQVILGRDESIAATQANWFVAASNLVTSSARLVTVGAFNIDRIFGGSSPPFLCSVEWATARTDWMSSVREIGPVLSGTLAFLQTTLPQEQNPRRVYNCELPPGAGDDELFCPTTLGQPDFTDDTPLMESFTCTELALESGWFILADMLDNLEAYSENWLLVIPYFGSGNEATIVAGCQATRPEFTYPPALPDGWAENDLQDYSISVGCLVFSLIPYSADDEGALAFFDALAEGGPCVVFAVVNGTLGLVIETVDDLVNSGVLSIFVDASATGNTGDNGGFAFIAQLVARFLGRGGLAIQYLAQAWYQILTNTPDMSVFATVFRTIRDLASILFSQSEIRELMKPTIDFASLIASFLNGSSNASNIMYQLKQLLHDILTLVYNVMIQLVSVCIEFFMQFLHMSAELSQRVATFAMGALSCIMDLVCVASEIASNAIYLLKMAVVALCIGHCLGGFVQPPQQQPCFHGLPCSSYGDVSQGTFCNGASPFEFRSVSGWEMHARLESMRSEAGASVGGSGANAYGSAPSNATGIERLLGPLWRMFTNIGGIMTEGRVPDTVRALTAIYGAEMIAGDPTGCLYVRDTLLALMASGGQNLTWADVPVLTGVEAVSCLLAVDVTNNFTAGALPQIDAYTALVRNDNSTRFGRDLVRRIVEEMRVSSWGGDTICDDIIRTRTATHVEWDHNNTVDSVIRWSYDVCVAARLGAALMREFGPRELPMDVFYSPSTQLRIGVQLIDIVLAYMRGGNATGIVRDAAYWAEHGVTEPFLLTALASLEMRNTTLLGSMFDAVHIIVTGEPSMPPPEVRRRNVYARDLYEGMATRKSIVRPVAQFVDRAWNRVMRVNAVMQRSGGGFHVIMRSLAGMMNVTRVVTRGIMSLNGSLYYGRLVDAYLPVITVGENSAGARAFPHATRNIRRTIRGVYGYASGLGSGTEEMFGSASDPIPSTGCAMADGFITAGVEQAEFGIYYYETYLGVLGDRMLERMAHRYVSQAPMVYEYPALLAAFCGATPTPSPTESPSPTAAASIRRSQHIPGFVANFDPRGEELIVLAQNLSGHDIEDTITRAVIYATTYTGPGVPGETTHAVCRLTPGGLPGSVGEIFGDAVRGCDWTWSLYGARTAPGGYPWVAFEVTLAFIVIHTVIAWITSSIVSLGSPGRVLFVATVIFMYIQYRWHPFCLAAWPMRFGDDLMLLVRFVVPAEVQWLQTLYQTARIQMSASVPVTACQIDAGMSTLWHPVGFAVRAYLWQGIGNFTASYIALVFPAAFGDALALYQPLSLLRIYDVPPLYTACFVAEFFTAVSVPLFSSLVALLVVGPIITVAFMILAGYSMVFLQLATVYASFQDMDLTRELIDRYDAKHDTLRGENDKNTDSVESGTGTRADGSEH